MILRKDNLRNEVDKTDGPYKKELSPLKSRRERESRVQS